MPASNITADTFTDLNLHISFQILKIKCLYFYHISLNWADILLCAESQKKYENIVLKNYFGSNCSKRIYLCTCWCS